MALSNDVKNITEVLARDLSSGSPTRQSVGSKTAAFAWTTGLPLTLADFVSTAKAASLSVPITRVGPSGTPVAIVAEKAVKPTAVTITPATVTLVKHSGVGQFSLEQLLNSDGLAPAVAAVLGAGALLSFEGSAMATLSSDSGNTATGATWVAALLTAQAKVLSGGGRPGLVVLSAADYPAVVTELGGSAGFVTSPDSPVGAFFGSAIHVSPKAVTGTAYVLDAGAVLALEHESSPILVSDPFSLSGTNEIRLVGDLLAGVAVTSPALVVKTTKTP